MPLDPTAFSAIVKIYQENIDSLIANMGKNVELHFFKKNEQISNNFFDPVRGSESRKPDYKGDNSNIPINRPEIVKVIKALTQTNPRDLDTFGDIRIQNSQCIVRLKTFLTDVPDLVRCEFIIPNLDSDQFIGMRFKLLKSPIPKGLQINRYAVSYWVNI